MTLPNGLQVGIGVDVAAYPQGSHTSQRGFWRTLISRLDDVVEFITLEDGFAASGGDGLDAILLANWLAPRSRKIGILAGAPINHLEPFHVSTAVATLDYVSEGRAGLFAQQLRGDRVLQAQKAIGALGGFPTPDGPALEQDAKDAIDVIRRLWDSWEEDAIVRDRESFRFLDGAKLHYINFESAGFKVLGPSITPRPPQGQPVVAAVQIEGDDASATADVVFIGSDLRGLPDGPKAQAFFVDLDIDAAAASVTDFVAEVGRIATSGANGVRVIVRDPKRQLDHLVNELLPAFEGASLLRKPGSGTLRERFGLPAAVNRYTSAA
ncbi:LLM class flavin-dependent oxidoreductase [Rhizobium leguminosarum]|uniref:LLM class flavin-dependent oxidoreductase n=1 Tax=Rhizobium leguminosarum TaxID=384 RepID=UPI0004857950|nr:LLM class flavin-dependent oxidoreductase [Rhizobium leguminosarum]NKL44045.1 LLM class flavin-dependent oxidoreductase [Rhizobium leguminosarum bv. viciae]UIJ82179.1 LLM class flavin-dependent oxidoreductase [Rhizobium leguminosarum]WFT89507.1 LLM class flavin-dependent oxidoreductase [Rhizobium leguminosarum]